jgi:serine/threonine protein kinase
MTPCGTYEYAAPEVIQEIEYSKKVDMWALGCALFTLLVAYPPFYDDETGLLGDKIRMGQFEFLSPWWDGISPDAKDLISRLLEVDPRVRLGTVQVSKHPWLASSEPSPTSLDPPIPLADARKASWATCRSAQTPSMLSPGVCRSVRRPEDCWSPIAETLRTPAVQTPCLSDTNDAFCPGYFQVTEAEEQARLGDMMEGSHGEISSPMPWTPFQDSPRWREALNAPLKHFTETTSLAMDRDLEMFTTMTPSSKASSPDPGNPFELNLSSSTLHKKRHLK